jgi:hypothetical protein
MSGWSALTAHLTAATEPQLVLSFAAMNWSNWGRVDHSSL